MGAAIIERTVDVDGIEIFLREVEGDGPPAVFVHGNPTNSTQWLPFLERIEGPAIAFDLPGWGRSARPVPLQSDGSIAALANIVEALLDRVAPNAYRLVVQDWGSLALIPAQRHRERVERLVIINTVPLLPGYRWHWIARIWRRRGVGEAFNATSSKAAMAQILRLARAGNRPMPSDFIEMLWEPFDAGTKRAILALYRSADPAVLEASGSRLGELDCPALVVWGRADPFIDARFGRAYAAALPNAELVELADAGHWPWIDRPDTVDLVLDHLDG